MRREPGGNIQVLDTNHTILSCGEHIQKNHRGGGEQLIDVQCYKKNVVSRSQKTRRDADYGVTR
jgi:hypothetical protein